MKRFVVTFVFLLALSCVGLLVALVDVLFLDDQFDSAVVTGPAFEIHAEAWKEAHFGLAAPGGIYEYRCIDNTTDITRLILSLRFSHPDPIPVGQIIILDSQIAYLWHEFALAVTVDGGSTWTVHGNPSKSLDTLYLWEDPRITNVTIAPDGTGLMSIEPYSWQSMSHHSLRTDDYGVTWVPVGNGSENAAPSN